MTMNPEIDQNKLKVAIDWINKLANGINPINGSVLSDSDIVNNVHISRCLFFVANLLEKAEQKKQSSAKPYDREFYLPPEDLSRVYIAENCSISELVKEINKVIPNNMKPLAATSVTKWLMRLGYLEEVVKENGSKARIPSDLGRSIGISSEQKSGPNGDYFAVSYNANAQRFILDNLFQE